MPSFSVYLLPLLILISRFRPSTAFLTVKPASNTPIIHTNDDSTITTTLRMASPTEQQKRQPRRSLKKRNRRRRMMDGAWSNNQENADDFPWETAESRPMVQSYAKELGEDYWVDEEELRKSKERQAALKALEPGQIPKEKLWEEVLNPYRQNWIGLISVTIVVFAFIFQNFPELISPPMIVNIPDLL